jgi:molybdate transport system substrate-binding protein
MRHIGRRLFCGGGLALACHGPALAQGSVTVAASESFRDPLQILAAAYKQDHGVSASLSFGASSAIADQVAKGGVDIVVCAQSWADTMEKDGRLRAESRKDLLGDHLVLIAPARQAGSIVLKPGAPLVAMLGGGKLALADPDKTQTGRFARAALESLGLWNGVAQNLVATANVRAALAAVADGSAALGVVYRTDLQGHDDVRIAGSFPDDSHPPIAYSFALTAAAAPAAPDLLTFLESKDAMARYADAGFVVPGGA